MKAVIDASLLVRAVAPGLPGHQEASRCLEGLAEAKAPHLLFLEVTTAIRRLEHAGLLTQAASDLCLASALQLSVVLSTPEGLHAEAMSLARKLGLSRTQDATYLALAQSSKCPLLTFDTRFQRNAASHGYDVRVPQI